MLRTKYLFTNNLASYGRGVHLIPHSKREVISYQVRSKVEPVIQPVAQPVPEIHDFPSAVYSPKRGS